MRGRPEQTGEQTWDGEVGIERLPVQAGSRSKHLDLRQLVLRRRLQPLRQAGRKREGAAVGEVDDYAVDLPVVAGTRRPGLSKAGRLTADKGGVDLVIS